MRTPLISMPLAAHSRLNILSKSGSCSNNTCVSLDLSSSKACCCDETHGNGSPFFIYSWRGAAMVLKLRTKYRSNPTIPRKLRTCVIVVGIGQLVIEQFLFCPHKCPALCQYSQEMRYRCKRCTSQCYQTSVHCVRYKK
jgi:hypothetical protein